LWITQEVAELGISADAVRQLVRSGVCQRLRRDVYVLTEQYPAYAHVRHVVLATAILRRHAGRIAASHHTAAALAGLPTWGVPYDDPRFVRVVGSHTGSRSTLRVGRVWPEDAYERVKGLWILRPVVAALQTAMAYGLESGVVTLDAGLRSQVIQRPELEHWTRQIAGHRHCVRARAATRLADGRSESPGESRLRIRLQALGFTDLEPQVELWKGTRLLGRVDLLDRERRIVIEFDGQQKYDAATGRSALIAEKAREDEIRSDGYAFVRFVWSDLADRTRLLAKMTRASSMSYAKVG